MVHGLLFNNQDQPRAHVGGFSLKKYDWNLVWQNDTVSESNSEKLLNFVKWKKYSGFRRFKKGRGILFVSLVSLLLVFLLFRRKTTTEEEFFDNLMEETPYPIPRMREKECTLGSWQSTFDRYHCKMNPDSRCRIYQLSSTATRSPVCFENNSWQFPSWAGSTAVASKTEISHGRKSFSWSSYCRLKATRQYGKSVLN